MDMKYYNNIYLDRNMKFQICCRFLSFMKFQERNVLNPSFISSSTKFEEINILIVIKIF